jgi:hypothetical protein
MRKSTAEHPKKTGQLEFKCVEGAPLIATCGRLMVGGGPRPWRCDSGIKPSAYGTDRVEKPTRYSAVSLATSSPDLPGPGCPPLANTGYGDAGERNTANSTPGSPSVSLLRSVNDVSAADRQSIRWTWWCLCRAAHTHAVDVGPEKGLVLERSGRF